MVSQKRRRVVIVDDSRTSQAILEIAFNARPDFEVVGVAADATRGLDLVKRLKPDLVTIDLCMPYVDGSTLLQSMKDIDDVRSVVVSEQVAKNVALSTKLEALGAVCCLSKRELTEDRASFFKKLNKAFLQSGATARPGGERAANDLLRPNRSLAVAHSGFPVPADEGARLDVLRRKRLANAVRERHFDLITRHVADVTGFPVCLLTFIDHDTQWIKSSFGYEGESGPRAAAFCNYTIAGGAPFVVTNARMDSRFLDNPFVVGEAGFRTYAGHPIVSADGTRLGALCVLARHVRPVTSMVAKELATMSELLGSMIDIRPALAA